MFPATHKDLSRMMEFRLLMNNSSLYRLLLLATLLFTLNKLMRKTTNCMYRYCLRSFLSPRSWSWSFLLVRKLSPPSSSFFPLLDPTSWSHVRTYAGGGRSRGERKKKTYEKTATLFENFGTTYLLTDLLSPNQNQAKFGRNSSSQNSPCFKIPIIITLL